MAEWLRRQLKALVRKSVGSNPTDCIFFMVVAYVMHSAVEAIALHHACGGS